MRSRSLLAPLAVAAALGFTFVGCDTVDQPASTPAAAVILDAHTASTGDVLYDLSPLDLGERFDVAIEAGDDEIKLRSTRTSAGYQLDFVPGDLRPDSVVVTYLRDGVLVSDVETYTGEDPAPAGFSDEGPDSWHYTWQDGSWILSKDYKNGLLAGGSTTFTKPSGEVIQVSDVVFTVYGLDAPPPRTVRFETPRAIEVTAQAFGRPLRQADLIRH